MRSSRVSFVLLLIAAVTVAIATGCSPTPLLVWTNIPEAAPIVEQYNLVSDKPTLLHYEEDLARALRLSDTPPDLVIGSGIEDESSARLFVPIGHMLDRKLDRDAFYEPLLDNGVRGDRQLLLPVSFNLPLVYFASDSPVAGGRPLLTLEEMEAQTEAFAVWSGERPHNLSYSPRWEGPFAYQFTRASGVSFEEDESGSPTWDSQRLASAIEAAQEWIEAQSGDAATDVAFENRYLYAPQMQLVREGRVGFGYDESNAFFVTSDRRTAGLDFKWLTDGEHIRVLESVVYAGIPAGARSRRGSERFLEWFFQVNHQVSVIEDAVQKQAGQFGIAGGFSALWRVNERFLPELYPRLSGKIPAADYLEFPGPAPRHWAELIENVVEPWLIRELSGREQSRDLESSVRAWLLQQEE